MFNEFCKMIRESLQDNATGRYSHARILSMLVALGATVFMWKLIILGGMSLEYFIAYLAYGTGHQSLNKFLDNKDSTRVAEVEMRKSESINSRSKQNTFTDDDLPRPPKI